MSHLTDLIARAKAKDAELGLELEKEFKALSARRAFGLNFERHQPESVELPGRIIRKGDKVRILEPRGSTKKGDQRLWRVTSLNKSPSASMASLELLNAEPLEKAEASVDDLVVVASVRDHIYPGLASTGKVSRGGDKPFHTVINGENFHALEALTYTHRGKIDVVYIDPPYNTGAKDWKYNNDYVDGEDNYRHSKWLAMMERRLVLVKELLKPGNSTLIVTIDEKEYLRLGLLLEQVFPESNVQMVSSVINPKGAARGSSFGRTDEYLYFVTTGSAAPVSVPLGTEWKIVQDKRAGKLRWAELMRSGSDALRSDSPNQFYPIFLYNSDEGPKFHSVGESYFGDNYAEVEAPEGCVAIWPIRSDGTEGRWQNSAKTFQELRQKGYIRLGKWRAEKTAITYVYRGQQKKVEDGTFPVIGRKPDGSIIVNDADYQPTFIPGTQWRIPSHNAEQGGTNLQKALIPGRKFPFPKSLYAVEDAVRFFVANNPEATILDFFAGSGTTTHAVMRLNKQDGGRRQCISVTNNEVAADEHKALQKLNLRPGDPDWEEWGICEHITKPRIKAAITGETPDGKPIKGDYKFTDEFPMAEGFEENAEFFTLSYETPLAVSHNIAFSKIAPLLWMRAGSQGARIDEIPSAGWAVVERYGVISDLDQAADYCAAVSDQSEIRIAYIVTDDDKRFQSIVRQLPRKVEPVRLYESYLSNFRFSMGR